MIILYAAALYAVLGFVTAAAFVTIGVTRVQPQPVSAGARALLFPAAAVLWPYIVVRWLKAAQ